MNAIDQLHLHNSDQCELWLIKKHDCAFQVGLPLFVYGPIQSLMVVSTYFFLDQIPFVVRRCFCSFHNFKLKIRWLKHSGCANASLPRGCGFNFRQVLSFFFFCSFLLSFIKEIKRLSCITRWKKEKLLNLLLGSKQELELQKKI